MALADILRAIGEEADEEIRRVIAEAESRRSEVLERAAAEAEAIAREADERALAIGEGRAEGIVNSARLDADRTIRQTREELYQALVDLVRTRLTRVADGPAYPRVWPLLFDECRRVVPEGRIVRVRASDADRALAVAIESGVSDVEVEAGLETCGGLELATEDGRVVRNTFEDRLAKADPHLRLLAGDLIPGLREQRP